MPERMEVVKSLFKIKLIRARGVEEDRGYVSDPEQEATAKLAGKEELLKSCCTWMCNTILARCWERRSFLGLWRIFSPSKILDTYYLSEELFTMITSRSCAGTRVCNRQIRFFTSSFWESGLMDCRRDFDQASRNLAQRTVQANSWFTIGKRRHEGSTASKLCQKIPSR